MNLGTLMWTLWIYTPLVSIDYNNLFGWHLFLQMARGKTRVVEASPTYERYLRQRDNMERSYHSPPYENWKQMRYYTARSPQRGRSGSPTYARINLSQQRPWHTADGHKRILSPNYGEMAEHYFEFCRISITNFIHKEILWHCVQVRGNSGQ